MVYFIYHQELTFILMDNETKAPCGDVNIFMLPTDDEDEKIISAEIEVMVAGNALICQFTGCIDPKSRKKGIAREALLLMMRYGTQHLQIEHFVAKILQENEPSQKLFASLNYVQTKFVKAFGEYWYERKNMQSLQVQQDLQAATQHMQVVEYCE